MSRRDVTVYLLETNTAPPLTFAFQTASGTRGLLRIARFMEQPNSVRLQFKQGPSAISPKPATRNSVFGPVIERVVNGYGAEAGNQGLDFESGRQLSIPERPLYNEELRMKWIADHGVDLLVVNKGGIKWNLVGLDFKLARLSERQWDDAAPEALRRALDVAVMETEDGWRFHAINDRLEKPLVFALQTGSGAIGLLQITGMTENPRGVKLRYKLVQELRTTTTNAERQTHVETSAATAQSGDYKIILTNGVSFEIVAICRNPRESNIWWKPDGTHYPTPPVELVQIPKLEAAIVPPNEFLIHIRQQFSSDFDGRSWRRQHIWNPPHARSEYFTTIRDELGKKTSAELIYFTQPPDVVDYRVVTAAGPWTPIAIHDGKTTRELVPDVMVVCSAPSTPQGRGDAYQFEVMHNVELERSPYVSGEIKNVALKPRP